MDSLFKQDFPLLKDVASKKTSEVDGRYNCIAWAFGDNRRHWWPNQKRSYWPINCSGMSVSVAFQELFKRGGWEQAINPYYEIGHEKIALYTLNGEPTHASRLLPNGRWTSKLGQNIDLTHELSDLEGPKYGKPTSFYRKRIQPLANVF
jgi:hypothetical protein